MVTGLAPGPEFDLIRQFLNGVDIDRPDVRVGPGDDAAVVAGDGIVVTVDMSIEDVHFRRGWVEPEELGYRATAAAISDLAAMAARPIGVLASIALASGDERGPGAAVMVGVRHAVGSVDAALLGGDLARSSGPLVIDVVAIGQAAAPVRRSGASPGDEVWVTGELGAAAAAVEAWLRDDTPHPAARSAFARPTPRIREALWLAERGLCTALVDLSDGIAGDAGHIAAASGVRVVVEAGRLPVAAPAAGPRAVALAAAGGEDYELCFTAAAGAVGAVAARFTERFGVPLTRVGHVETGQGSVVVDADGAPIELDAYQHWGAR